MALVTGNYKLKRNENLVEYLTGTGLPQEKAEEFNSILAPFEVKLFGEKVKFTRPYQGDTVFILGEEYEEKTPNGPPLKNIAHLVNNVLTIKTTYPGGKTGEKIYEFSNDGVIVTLKADMTPVVAKRFYSRS